MISAHCSMYAVVWLRAGMGFTFRDIAKRLHISVGTAHQIYARFDSTGDVAPCNLTKHPELRKLDEHHELPHYCFDMQ